ncbi:unnamed protein product [Pocillopora meandrina]|uniref:Uncharacterized protein n=1 Tax=Pocillopora meandrina TaxID=46732 RepID=A0AAU9XSI0_9CNID|nr:unnamed protein product [Pocillopora meandrina]
MRMALIVLKDCEENNFIETIKSPKDDDTTSTHPLYLFLLDSCQENESGKGACLYVSSAKSSDSTQSSSRSWRLSGFTVNKESSIALASQLCASVRMALIVLEDCEENNFIETIKSSKACNEHTPIVFISSGPLSDT